MSKQHYFVVYFDNDTKQWVHDPDTEETYLDNQTVYNTKKYCWEYGYLGDMKFNDDNDRIAEKLAEMLAANNNVKEAQ